MIPRSLRAAALASVAAAAGFAAARSLRPAPAASPPAERPATDLSTTPTASNPGATSAPFTGTAADLLRIARESGSVARATLPLLKVTDPLPAATIGKLTAELKWRPNLAWFETAVFAVLIGQWAEKDAAAALAWSATLSPVHRLQLIRGQILEAVAAADPERALALAAKIPGDDDRRSAICAIAETIAATDPRRGLSLVQTHGGFSKAHHAHQILAAWASTEPAAAWAAALAWPQAGSRDQACLSVISTWASQDRDAALAAILQLPQGNRKRMAMEIFYQTWSTESPKDAYDAVMALPSGPERSRALASALSGWAQHDPRAAAAALEQLPFNQQRVQLTHQVFSQWAQQDPLAASAAADALPPRQRQEALTAIAGTWSWKDPKGALAWAKSLPDSHSANMAMSAVFPSLVREDAEAAAATWRTLTPRQQRQQLPELMQNWASQDKDAALAFARSLSKPQDRASALGAAAAGMGLDNPTALNSLLAEIPEGPLRVEAMQRIAQQQAHSDPEGLASWLQSVPETARTRVLVENGYWIGNFDPKLAIALLDSTPDAAAEASHLLSTVAQNYASEDPAAALAWASSIQSPEGRSAALGQTLRALAEQDPAGAAQQAVALDPKALDTVIDVWSERDPDALLAWAASAPPDKQELAMLKASMAKSGNDPAAGADIVSRMASSSQTPSGSLFSATTEVATAYFRDSVTDSATWAGSLPEGTARNAALQTITEQWTRLDPVAASEWVRQLPAGEGRDAAAERLSTGISQSDPESALIWASSIGAESQRDHTVRMIFEQWKSRDAEAARAGLEASSISDSLRRSLLDENR
jgi:hypothetical protein